MSITKLKRNEICPIHSSRYCCGRSRPIERTRPNPYARMSAEERDAAIERRRQERMPVRRVDDPHHPRGYRELRSKEEMRRLLKQKVTEQNGLCGICHEALTDFRGIVPDHIDPRGMNGAWRDDHPDNIQAAHSSCNMEKGSKRLGIGE